MNDEPRTSLARDPLPLRGKVVVVTGVSRRAGIGHAIACRMAAYGASVFCHHFAPHDRAQVWGGEDLAAVVDGVRGHLVGDARVDDLEVDLGDPRGPERMIEVAVASFGRVDALVCNQALASFDGAIGALSATDLDRHWAVDARASILLAQAFAERFEHGRTGSIVFLTSGQGLGPMPGEIAYAAAKAAIAGVTPTIADQLADRGIRVNAVNPGPTDTGYLDADQRRSLAPRFPFDRLGTPDDAARLVAWLVTDEAAWMTGQVFHSEGGFRRGRPPGG
ncbi:MAG: SDR family oxidoreductase [Trueperaceae bacterium]